MSNRITLKQATNFHGHLGPYLILGILAGDLAIFKLRCKKYFGLKVNVWGADGKPKSCLIDGLQLSTGATYGKGNISKHKGRSIKMIFRNCEDGKKISLGLRDELIKKLQSVTSHVSAERLARELYRMKPESLFAYRL